jgi:hypothetical protein
MSGILDLLGSNLGKSIISGVSGSAGTDESKTSAALTMALPVLMTAMKRNAATPKGAEGLMGALNGKHDGSILDNLGGLFGGGVDDNVKQEGDKILSHVLGDKQSGVEKIISEKSGLDAASIANILKISAPILMGVVGRQSKQDNMNSSGDLSGMLGNFIGGNDMKEEQNFLEKILDAGGDGSVVDDVASMVLGKAGGKKGGLGGLLGGLFGK